MPYLHFLAHRSRVTNSKVNLMIGSSANLNCLCHVATSIRILQSEDLVSIKFIKCVLFPDEMQW